MLIDLVGLEKLAGEIVKDLKGGDMLLLSGPLGAGKTTFVQALARVLGIKDKVNSPSYTIVGEYTVPSHSVIKKLIHVDLYRLEKNVSEDPAIKDVFEQIHEPGRLTVIEWGERLGKKAPAGKWIKFDYGSTADERVVTLETNGPQT